MTPRFMTTQLMTPQLMSPQLPRPRPWMLSIAALVLVISSCVVPAQETAQPISVPDDVFVTTSLVTTVPEPEVIDVPSFSLSLYWQFQDDQGATRLLRVRRNIEGPSTAAQALSALVDGPTPEERAAREDSGAFFPRVSEIFSPTVGAPNENGVVRVTISDEAGFKENDLDKIPVAEEIVCTLTAIPSINGVVIEDSTGEIPLPDRESQPIVGAAARSNYNCDQVLDEIIVGQVEPSSPATTTPTTTEG